MRELQDRDVKTNQSRDERRSRCETGILLAHFPGQGPLQTLSAAKQMKKQMETLHERREDNSPLRLGVPVETTRH